MFTIHSLLKAVEKEGYKKGYYIDNVANDYAEPGYTKDDDDLPIVFANWNEESKYNKETKKFETIDDFMPRLAKLLERAGYTIEWSDEWWTCGDCGKAFRNTGDSYGWTMYGHYYDGEVQCGDCILEDPSDYLSDLEGQNDRANTIRHLNPGDHGYVKLNDMGYQSGWYGGQLDDPNVIGKNLTELGIERYLFDVNSVGQFDIRFSVYIHEDELDENGELPNIESEADNDPADILKSSLKEASIKTKELQGDGVKVSKMNPDGTADVKIVSPEDFINGKALDK